MRFLALILFTPAFALLAWLYWTFPRALPRSAKRRAFDLSALSAAFVASVAAVSFAVARPAAAHGELWPQIVATLAAYHVFPLVLAAAWLFRGRWLARNP